MGKKSAPIKVRAEVAPLVQPFGPMNRFTINVSEGLHRRIKTQHAGRGAKMADAIRDLVEQEFLGTPRIPTTRK